MKILMLSPSYDPIIGGTESVVQNLALKLNEIGIHTDIMTFNMNEKWNPIWKEEVEEYDFKVFRVPAFNIFHKCSHNPLEILFGVNVIPKLSFTKRLENYDIIHFHDDVDLSFPLFSYFIKKPKILHCHSLNGTYEYYARSFLARKLLGKIADSYLCTCYSEYRFLKNLGIPRSRIFILNNGVDTETFVPKENGKLDDLILYVGRIIRRKGLHILLESLLYLELPTHLVIIGPEDDSKYLDEVRDIARRIESKTLHEITFLGVLGSTDKNALVGWYQKASVYVCSSTYEPFGITNLEALACRTPVIGSNVGGIPEIIKDGFNGVLVNPNDPKMLASALKRLLENRELREEYGKRGRRMVEEHFSWVNISKELAKIYEKMC